MPGYTECSRRDRHAGSNRGGILTLVRDDFNGLVHIANSKDEERSWHFLKIGIETILIANWYRPGASEFDGFSELYAELGEFFSQATGVVIMGDLNIHHKRWLKYSREDSRIGAEMKTLCDFHGLFQIVREPTRYAYLLDLVCTDIVGASATVLPSIADHAGVKVRLPIPEVKETKSERIVWDLVNANWKDLEVELAAIDWSILASGTADDALNKFMDVLWNLLIKYIPQKKIVCKKSTHPWLNSKCQAAILRKNKAEGSEVFQAESAACASILQDERAKYVEKLKAKIAALPKRSKQWWRLNRELLHRKASIKAIPP